MHEAIAKKKDKKKKDKEWKSYRTRQSTQRAQTSLAKADYYPHLCLNLQVYNSLTVCINECRALVVRG